MAFKVPNKYRVREHMLLPSDDSDGNNGYFEIPLEEGVVAKVIASDGMGWDHVSVHIEEDGEDQTPTWDEMCRIQDMFWGKEACLRCRLLRWLGSSIRSLTIKKVGDETAMRRPYRGGDHIEQPRYP